MDKFGRGSRFAIALAAMAIATLCAAARADDEAPLKHGASLGLATQRITDTWREKNAYRASGVLVIGVDPAGRAAKSGISTGDVLVSVDGRTLREPSDLGYAERNLHADQPVAVVLARDGGHSIKMFDIAPLTDAGPSASATAASMSAGIATEPIPQSTASADPGATGAIAGAAAGSVVMDAAPKETNSIEAAPSLIIARADSGAAPLASAAPAATATTSAAAASGKTGAAELGVRGQALTPDLATALGAEGVDGVLVLDVGKESPADHAGLKPGDIIFKIGDQEVKDEATLDQAVIAATNPAAISMLRRGDQNMVLAPLEGHPAPASLGGAAAAAAPSAADQQQVINELKGEVASLKKELADLKEQIAKLVQDSAKPKQ